MGLVINWCNSTHRIIFLKNGLFWDFFIYFHWFSQKSLKVDEEIKALERRRDFGKIIRFCDCKAHFPPLGSGQRCRNDGPCLTGQHWALASCDRGAGHGEAARDESVLEVRRVVGGQGKKRLMSNCSSLSQNCLFCSPLHWSVTDSKIHPAQGHWPSHTF